MAKVTIPFEAFVDSAGDEHADYITDIHEYLSENDYKIEVKEAASGYVVSYKHTPSRRSVLNYVFRKKGLMMRVYADNIPSYMEILSDWSSTMKENIKKAGPCKRLLNPEDCNPRCLTGFDFLLDGEHQQKCRLSGFFTLLTDETKPYLKDLVEHEVQSRK